jgi:hypothetical protein
LDSINKKEHDDTMASLTEMGLTGIGTDGKPTPKFKAELDKIHTDANAARQRVQQGWRKIHDAAVHNTAMETAATARANRPVVRSISGGGLVAVYPDGTTKTLRKPGATGGDKPFHWTYRGGAFSYDPATKKVTQLRKPAGAIGGSGTAGLSSSSYAVARRNAGKAMDLWYYGDEKKGISAIDYPKAVRLAMHQFSLSRPDATALANDFYAPGEGGRPTGNPAPKAHAKSKGPLGVQAVG